MSAGQLLQEARDLSLPELERFVAQVIALQAQRKASSLSLAESDLLLCINQGLPADLQQRYHELLDMRQIEALTPAEQEELKRITGQVENLETQRVDKLIQLARLRQTTLTELMRSLGLGTPRYA